MAVRSTFGLVLVGVCLGAVLWLQSPVLSLAAAPDGSPPESSRPLLDFVFLALGLVLASAGGVGLYGTWYHRGRDPHVERAIDLRSEPPDDLPPGAAGALLDEHADLQDVVATFVDLHRRGIFTLAPVASDPNGPGRGRTDYELTLVEPNAPVAPFEEAMLRALFGPEPSMPWQPKLSDVKHRFNGARSTIREAIYAELVQRGYFVADPQQVRSHWRQIGISGLVASLGAGSLLGVAFGGMAWFPAIVGPCLPLAVLGMSRSMPRKTRKGAEAAAQWDAFRRYLNSNEAFAVLFEAQAIRDTYLTYAIAFGIEQTWLQTLSPERTQPSVWAAREPLNVEPLAPRFDLFGGDWGLGDFRVGSVADIDLQGTSDLLGSALQGASDGLGGLLDAAADAFGDFDFG